MRLRVLAPTEIVVDEPVARVIGEAENGAFCLLPRHIGFVTALAPGLLSYETPEGEEVFLAVDEGILVKCGSEVRVSTRYAARGPDLDHLRETVERRVREIDDRERRARSALARLEADLVRRFVEMGHP